MSKLAFVLLLLVCYNEAANVRIFTKNDKSIKLGRLFPLSWQAIFPGTKWCGDGDIAEDYDDLGYFKEVDMCCRDHDYCPDVIFAGETKYGLENKGKFSRLHCHCDSDFYDCLHDTGSNVAGIIGSTYFTGLGGQCFMEEYPTAGCVEYQQLGPMKRCVEYVVDATRPKEYQWFDVPFY